jgi:hypothetical protein
MGDGWRLHALPAAAMLFVEHWMCKPGIKELRQHRRRMAQEPHPLVRNALWARFAAALSWRRLWYCWASAQSMCDN